MRLSRDSSSWKSNGIKRRDFRHTHDGPEVPPHRSPPRPKHWCRGVVGRSHIPGRVQGKWYDHDACTVCGKHLAYYWRPWR